jgi:rRNA maturation protein Nop10
MSKGAKARERRDFLEAVMREQPTKFDPRDRHAAAERAAKQARKAEREAQ